MGFFEARKVENFELGVGDVMHANIQNVSQLIFFFIFLLILKIKNVPLNLPFIVFLTTFYELMQLRTFGWLTCVIDVIQANEYTHNMLIVAYRYIFGIFGWFHFVLWCKKIILIKNCYFGLKSLVHCLATREENLNIHFLVMIM